MSTMTTAGNQAPTGSAPAAPGRARGLRLGGMNWLVWRQHRAAYWTLLAAAAVTVVLIVVARQQMMTYLDGYGYPQLKPDWEDRFNHRWLDIAALVIGYMPILVGIFVGAPLLAGDLENGTAKLVNSQSASRVRWLATKLGVTALVVAVSTTVVAVAFGWWWTPIKTSSYVFSWIEGPAFDNTGPLPAALTLLTVVGGVAIGMLLRRTLISMVVTFGFAVAVQVAWSQVRQSLGTVLTVTSDKGVGDGSMPPVPEGAYVVDQSYVTSSGDFIGWGSCAEATEKASNACLEQAHVVGWGIEYIPLSQMASMQWLGASILLALTAGIAAFVILWGRKRLV
ncbi:ABC transporter [Streptomyces sp. NPDC087294]|uniref:ABC transporter n=1 Tax=Streptomyces sp. NPDC087294 TaxID=3365777 RepID=UPI00380F8057